MSETRLARGLALAWLLAAVALAGFAAGSAREVELANYSTSLAGRTPGQRHNVRLAAAAVDQAVVPPGGAFSFNTTVGPWVRSRGYRRAPVSFGGSILLDYGGGVCQLSSTLYNAALLAGLEVVERDHHVWQPLYVPPGRDAAVAQGIADLRLRNPYPAPVLIRATVASQRVEVRLFSRHQPAERYDLEVEALAMLAAPPMVRYDRHLPGDSTPRLRPGRPGRRVRVTRTTTRRGQPIAREPISDDTYLSLSPVTEVGGWR